MAASRGLAERGSAVGRREHLFAEYFTCNAICILRHDHLSISFAFGTHVYPWYNLVVLNSNLCIAS